MHSNVQSRAIALSLFVPTILIGQIPRQHDPVLLKNWPAPLYWQPSQAERGTPGALATLAPQATATNLPIGTNALVFVAMTPCRVADTRTGQGFSGAFGPPSLVGGAPGRTFPVQSSTTCSIPSVALAYSFNLTVVAPAPFGFITAYPTPGPLPLAATLDWAQSLIVSNAAIVPAGTNGSVDVYANANTDLVIDINGYYAPPGDLNGNTAFGNGALASNTSGINNTASGFQALQDNTTGGTNTATGYQALQTNTTGNGNTANGSSALQSNTTGIDNTANGFYALHSNTAGGYNTANGSYALQSNTTGNNNIAVGYRAAINVSGGNSNNIHIGSMGASGDSGTIRIGTPGTQTSLYVAGVIGAVTTNSAVPVLIDTTNGQLGVISSSRRYKEDIQDMGDASRGLMRLRPVTFRYQKPLADGAKPIQYGLIAEEVAKVYPDLVARSADGQIESVKYQVLDSMLLNELQKEHARVQRQAWTIRSLEERLAKVEAALQTKK